MKLDRLHLKNFRCFDELDIDFGQRLTVIIADNGAGKTAILDAIAIGFGRYLTKLPGVAGKTTSITDLKIVEGEDSAPFMMLAWEARTPDGATIKWTASRKRDNGVTAGVIRELLSEDQQALLDGGAKELDDYALSLIPANAESDPRFIPVIAYYGTNRAIRDEVQRRRGFKKSFSRFDALSGALEPDSRFRAAFEWFNAMEDAERREREKLRDFDHVHPELEIVRDAIVRLLPDGFGNPRTEIRPLRFVIDRRNADGSTSTLRVSQLSDGYRVVLGLAMDFARRLAQANGRLAIEGQEQVNPLDLPAIALIDEVDLHLHPSWQQRVITDLMQTFRATQFIVTTHSPQVLSTVKRENVRVIGPNPEGRIIAAPPLAATYGEPSGDVLHSVMLVDPQPPVAEKADLQRLTELVDQGRYRQAEAQSLMHELSKTLGPHHPQLQKLQRSIRRQTELDA